MQRMLRVSGVHRKLKRQKMQKRNICKRWRERTERKKCKEFKISNYAIYGKNAKKAENAEKVKNATIAKNAEEAKKA